MSNIRRRLGWKLFLSYLVVIMVGVLSLAVVAELVSPTAFDRHMASMQSMMGGSMAGMMTDLTDSFQRAVNEILLVAASLAVVSAGVVSLFVARRIVRPIRELQAASRRIADGRYGERVQVSGADELAQLSRSFNQMAETLEQSETRRRQLIGDVAHELRTPLAGVIGVMEGLQDGVLPAEPATFHSVERELNRLQRLVLDLQELSRAEAGQISLNRQRVEPAEFVQTAVDRLRLQYEEKRVDLREDYQPDVPYVYVDPERMTQVMLNLLGNALQYTAEGGQVNVTVTNEGRGVSIIVQDTGIGISPEALPYIFERFYRADRSRSRVAGGSGIGLTISRHLVQAHGGTLTAASPGPGQGSTFTVNLPRAA